MIEEMNGKEAEEARKKGNQENAGTAANPDDLNESGEIDFRYYFRFYLYRFFLLFNLE